MFEKNQSLSSRTRRDFIKGNSGRNTTHIASLLVQAWPRRIDAVERLLIQIPGVDSHGPAGAGKLIVTVDTENDAALVDTIDRIGKTNGVIAASLVYHHMDQEDGDD